MFVLLRLYKHLYNYSCNNIHALQLLSSSARVREGLVAGRGRGRGRGKGRGRGRRKHIVTDDAEEALQVHLNNAFSFTLQLVCINAHCNLVFLHFHRRI